MTSQTIPTEVLTEIFSYLSMKDQLSCSLVCTIWQTVLLSTHALVASRYTTPSNTTLEFGTPATHKIFECDEWLICTFTGGQVTRYRFLDPHTLVSDEPTTEGTEPVASIHDSYPRLLSLDISNSRLLDEPFFSPFFLNEWYDTAASTFALVERSLRYYEEEELYSHDSWTRGYNNSYDSGVADALSIEVSTQTDLSGRSLRKILKPWLPHRNITVREMINRILGVITPAMPYMGLLIDEEYEVRFRNHEDEGFAELGAWRADGKWWATVRFYQ
ncbi:hypothetical protein AA313_de0203848 [Arthrobotrys entomopaga]|nr:hypothetical protein AA313_de0203848 [Arthrobotrys entomopaga]